MKNLTDKKVKEIIASRNNPEKRYHTLYNRYKEAEKKYNEVASDSRISEQYKKMCLTECSKAHLNLMGFCTNLVADLIEKNIDIFNL